MNTDTPAAKAKFTFKGTWLKAVEAISDPARQAELMMAIARYGLRGLYTPSDSETVNAVMQIVIADIDAATPVRKDSCKAEAQLAIREKEHFNNAIHEVHTNPIWNSNAAKAARDKDLGACLHVFLHECMVTHRFHDTPQEMLDDFRVRVSPGVYGDARAEARFFRRPYRRRA